MWCASLYTWVYTRGSKEVAREKKREAGGETKKGEKQVPACNTCACFPSLDFQQEIRTLLRIYHEHCVHDFLIEKRPINILIQCFIILQVKRFKTYLFWFYGKNTNNFVVFFFFFLASLKPKFVDADQSTELAVYFKWPRRKSWWQGWENDNRQLNEGQNLAK